MRISGSNIIFLNFHTVTVTVRSCEVSAVSQSVRKFNVSITTQEGRHGRSAPSFMQMLHGQYFIYLKLPGAVEKKQNGFSLNTNRPYRNVSLLVDQY